MNDAEQPAGPPASRLDDFLDKQAVVELLLTMHARADRWRWSEIPPLGRARGGRLVAAFLASDAASYVTGAVITVDGGRTGLTPATLPLPTTGAGLPTS